MKRPESENVVFSSRWFRVVAQPLQGGGDPYYVLDVPDYVSIVARTTDQRIVLVRQYRPVVDRESIELPSGHVEPGELPEAAARRELAEETGIHVDRLEPLGSIVPDIGRLRNRMWCYFAGDVAFTPGHVDENEGVAAFAVPEADALAMAADGRIEHAPVLSVLFLALRHGTLGTR